MATDQTEYLIRSQPTYAVTFRNTSGDLETPTAHVCRVLAPDGTLTTVSSPTTVSPGVLRWTLPVADQVGVWWVTAESSTPFFSVDEDSYEVIPSNFPA
jgi:hypothetical protein